MKRTRPGHNSGQPQRNCMQPRARGSIIQGQPVHYEPAIQNVERLVSLVTNAYSVNMSKAQTIVYEYELVITASAGGGDVSPKFLGRHFVTRSIRKLLMEKCFPKLMDQSGSGSLIIDINLEKVYTSKPLELRKIHNSSENEFVFKSMLVKTDLLVDLFIDIKIRFSAAKEPSTYSQSQKRNFVMSVLHHELLLQMLKYGSVYYHAPEEFSEDALRESRLDLISNHIIGMSLSGLRCSTGGDTLVVISCTNSYITRSYSLLDLIATYMTGKPTDGLHGEQSGTRYQVLRSEIENITGREAWFIEFSTMLNGFKCRVEAATDPINLRFSLTEEPAKELSMTSANKESISVIEYYKSFGVNLKYPNLPCLISNSRQDFYYPFELCTLLPGQKVPIFRLGSQARNHLATLNKPRPAMSKQSSSKAREDLEQVSKACLDTFGIAISRSPVEARGVTLQKPMLQFKGRDLEPQNDFWESGPFCHSMHLGSNWCVVNTVEVDPNREANFFHEFGGYCKIYKFNMGRPIYLKKSKQDILNEHDVAEIIEESKSLTRGQLRFILFVIDSSSTKLNRLIHLSFDDQPNITATCLRADSILNFRHQRSIFRTLIHKLNARLGGTNVTYHDQTLQRLSLDCSELMIVGLDVTHPDNELSGVSIVGCAFTYSRDLFKHRSLVWPQPARVEIIGRVDDLMRRLLQEYFVENQQKLPKHIIVYRDGVSHEEFERVQSLEIAKADMVMNEFAKNASKPKPNLSYIIAQKRHTMRFYEQRGNNFINPPSGTLINENVVTVNGREFYLYSNTGPQATARPLHYHVLLNGMGIENLQKLTYFLCFNFGKCSSTLSMPSSLRYAHNAAYDARNRVIAAREFNENMFYTSRFFC